MKKTLLALSLLSLASLSVQAATYTFVPTDATSTGGTGGSTYNFSDVNNWNNGTATGVAYPSTTADTANIGLTTGSQTVVYDSGASGTFGTLNMTNVGTGNNIFDIQKVPASSAALTTTNSPIIANGFTLGTGTTGTNTVILDAIAAPVSGYSQILTLGTVAAPTQTATLNAGGVLEFHPFVTTASNNAAQLNGNLSIAGGTFNIDQAQEASGQTQGSASNSINGTLNMSSGSIVFSKVVTANTSGNIILSDNRLNVNGNAMITGGSFSVATGSGTGNPIGTGVNANGGSLFLSGSANTITGVTGLNTIGLTFSNGTAGTTVTFITDQVLGTVVERLGASGKTLSITNNNTASTTGTINQLQFIAPSPVTNSATIPTETVMLGSNLTAISTAGSNSIQASNTGYGTNVGAVAFTLDLAGRTYDLSNIAAGYTPTNPSTSVLASFTYSSSTGTGTLRATGFNLSSIGGTATVNQVSTPIAGSTVGTNVILNSVGGNSTANVLSASSGSTGLISPTSTFLYSGAAVAATPATLTSSRNIGILQVTTGALNINQSALTTGGAVTISAAGTLVLNGTGYGTLTLGAGNFAANTGAILNLTLGANLDQIAAGGSGQSFSLNGVTIAINGSATGTSYQVFSGFTGTNTVTNVSFTGVPSGETASIDTTGLITFATAVPEPGTWVSGVILVVALGVWAQRRRANA